MSRWLIALTVILLPAAVLAQHGGIQGQVVLDGEIPQLADLVKNAPAVCGFGNIPHERIVVDPATKGVANVAIYLRRKPDDAKIPTKLAAVPEDAVTCTSAGCRFFPHVMVVRTDQQIKLLNRDGGPHQIRVEPVKNLGVRLEVQPEKAAIASMTRSETAPLPVRCDTYPWMCGYWVVVDHPYAVVTGADGKFKIKDLPEGEHEFRVWHESVGFVEKSLMVKVVSDQMTEVPVIKLKLSDSDE